MALLARCGCSELSVRSVKKQARDAPCQMRLNAVCRLMSRTARFSYDLLQLLAGFMVLWGVRSMRPQPQVFWDKFLGRKHQWVPFLPLEFLGGFESMMPQREGLDTKQSR